MLSMDEFKLIRDLLTRAEEDTRAAQKECEKAIVTARKAVQELTSAIMDLNVAQTKGDK